MDNVLADQNSQKSTSSSKGKRIFIGFLIRLTYLEVQDSTSKLFKRDLDDGDFIFPAQWLSCATMAEYMDARHHSSIVPSKVHQWERT